MKADEPCNQNTLLKDRLESLRGLILAALKEIESMTESDRREVNDEIPLFDAVNRFEADLLRKALISTRGHQARAAEQLGISPTTFHEKIKRHQIHVRKL